MKLARLLRAAVVSALLASVSACAPTYADGFKDAMAAGLRAKHAGRSEEAIAAFTRAAGLADRYKDREEARMLAAETLEYAGDPAAAEEIWRAIAKDADGRYHGARASFAVARLVLERDGLDAGIAETLVAIRANPNSGLVRHAVRRLLFALEERDGAQAAYDWLVPIEAELRPTDAGEAVSFELATLLGRCGKKPEAIASLFALARAYPYPIGSLNDDAYMAASQLLEEQGDVAGAIAALEEMLSPMEAAYNGSSYDRPQWPPGQYRIGVLQFEKLNDADRAVASLWKVYREHRTSRQTDDALFDIARVESSRGDGEAACEAMQTLRELNPESKFLRCGHYVCSTEAKPARPCSSDVLRRLGKDPDAEWALHVSSQGGEPPPPDQDDATKPR